MCDDCLYIAKVWASKYSIILDATIASFLFIGITQDIEGFVNVGYFAGWLFGRDSLAKEYKLRASKKRY
ncbi:hypothetical protein [Photorhabdus khanii]|uniref:Uncharacterized protein n=1 Tax=Photorhabdus khanii subsp. guanajuatensis TaxID=2100166 RepID=A0A4V2X9C2_9GAMM|nr:hypothetical protein [Photorhabdus khanii]TDB63155.1 hypothetical protein C5467_01045 [Photorhabdus khanii subsp. guanajuatensis]